jgi:hypothetical protein
MEGQFVPLSLTLLNGDPDFPVLFAEQANGSFPQIVLLVVDARNGKDTWSLRDDPIVFYLLFSDATTVEQVFLEVCRSGAGFRGVHRGGTRGGGIARGPPGRELQPVSVSGRFPEADDLNNGICGICATSETINCT